MRIPENKTDSEALVDMNKEFILNNQMELLKWMQETCWPIWGEVLETLQPHYDDLESSIIEILRVDNDESWKYNIIIGLINNAEDLSERIVEELKRLYYNLNEFYEVRYGCQYVFDKRKIYYLPCLGPDPE